MDIKIVLLLNKRLKDGVVLNAAAHLGIGLCGLLTAVPQDVGSATESEARKFNFQDYADADGNSHPFISGLSLIVLRGTSGDVRKCRSSFAEKGIPFVDYTNCMIGGSYVDQISRSQQTPERDLEYFGICAIGERSELDEITRRFSLWK